MTELRDPDDALIGLDLPLTTRPVGEGVGPILRRLGLETIDPPAAPPAPGGAALSDDDSADTVRLDPGLQLLRRLIAMGAAPQSVAWRRIPEEVHVFLSLRRPLTEMAAPLRDVQFRPTSVAGRIVAGRLPVRFLDALARIPGDGVESAELSRAMQHELDRSVPELFGGKMFADSRSRGKDVLIGIIDSSIDFWHPAFLEPKKSRQGFHRTRILALWDQTLTARGREKKPNLVPHDCREAWPEGFNDYGVVYRKTAINAALKRGVKHPCSVRHEWWHNPHGTHVAGIAAGRAHGTRGKRYTGVAPEADLLAVVAPDFSHVRTASLFDAVNFLIQEAARLKRPIVINISQGDNVGPHDGTSPLERGLTAVLSDTHSARDRTVLGRAIVKSAGNAFADGVHARGVIRPNGRTKLLLEVQTPAFDPPKDPAEREPYFIDIWYTGSDHVDVAVQPPSRSAGGPTARDFFSPASDFAATQLRLSPAGTLIAVTSTTRELPSLDHRISIQLLPRPGEILEEGTWTIRLRERSGVSQARFHSWIARVNDNHISFDEDDRHRNPRYTITEPGCARDVITVGAYGLSTKSRAELWGFSSSGPTRKEEYGKPDLCAPGSGICSALFEGKKWFARPDYGQCSGTSCAAPHVTGVIALMYERDRSLSPAAIKKALSNASAWPGPKAPRVDRRGAGKLYAHRALSSIPPKSAAPSVPSARRSPMPAQAAKDVQARAYKTMMKHTQFSEEGEKAFKSFFAQFIRGVIKKTPKQWSDRGKASKYVCRHCEVIALVSRTMQDKIDPCAPVGEKAFNQAAFKVMQAASVNCQARINDDGKLVGLPGGKSNDGIFCDILLAAAGVAAAGAVV